MLARAPAGVTLVDFINYVNGGDQFVGLDLSRLTRPQHQVDVTARARCPEQTAPEYAFGRA